MGEFKTEVSAAAALFLPFIALSAFLLALSPPTSAHLTASDPLVQLVHAGAGPWAIPVLSALPALTWIFRSPPSRQALSRAARGALGGVAVAAIGLPAVRLLVGPTLPAFVPPEESALSGIALGVGAGVLEEAVFRFGVLVAVFALARRFWPSRWARVAAVLATGLSFALAHELGPGAGSFEPRFFATRFVVPGCLMSIAFFRPGPSFLVTLHSAAHVGIALLFSRPSSDA